MGFFDTLVGGVQIWIWLLAIFSFGFFVVAYLISIGGWDKIRGAWWRVRFPERVIKVLIHYKSGYYRHFWRLEPSNNLIVVDKKNYIYDREQIRKEDDFYLNKHKDDKEKPSFIVIKNVLSRFKNGEQIFKIGETEEYTFEKAYKIKQKGKKWQEIHYIYNVPVPLKFDFGKGVLDFSSDTLKEFQDNDLFIKLMNLGQQKGLMMILMLIVGLNLVVTLFILGKLMGWIQ